MAANCKVLMVVFCMSYFINLQAQFNDSVNYHLKYAATGIINKTQDGSSYMLNNAAAFDVNKKRANISTNGSWVYGQSNGSLTNNDVNASSNIDLNRSLHKLYYWGLVTYESSYSLNITSRGQAGIGVGYTFVDKPQAWLVVSDGFLYETSNLIDAELGKDVYQTVRNSFRARYKFVINKIITVDGTHFYQPSMSQLKDYIIRTSNNVSFKLRQWINLTASLNYNRTSRTNRENLLMSFGVTVEKYF